MRHGKFGALIEQIRRASFRDDGNSPADGELLECYIARGDEAAFGYLVQRHAAMVLAVCRRVLGNEHDAEDAFQATFLVLARKARSIVQRQHVGNWLYGVAYRTALHARQIRARQQAKEKPMQKGAEPFAAQPDDGNELLPLLDKALNHLPERYRVAVVLCELEGRSRKAAADQLGIPEGTLSSRLAKARQLLARHLGMNVPTASFAIVAALLAQQASASSVPASLVAAASNLQITPTAKVLALAEGVVRTMLLIKIKKLALGLLLAPLLTWAAVLVVMPVLGHDRPFGVEADHQVAAKENPADAQPNEQKKAAKPEGKNDLTDQDRMQGVWRMVSAKFDGDPMPAAALKDMRLIVKGDTMLWDLGDEPTTPGKFTLAARKTPSQIAIKGEHVAGIRFSVAAGGVYKLEADKLWICVADEAKPEPRAFASAKGDDSLLCVLERDNHAAPDRVVVANGPAQPVKISAIVPGSPPTLSRVNTGRFRVQFQIENTGKNELILWPYLTLKVLGDQGKPVPQSRNLGRYGLRDDDKSILEEVSFVTLQPGATHTIDVSLHNYQWNSTAIQSWELKAAGNYSLELHYRYKRIDAKNDFGAGCKDVDNAKHAWNRALEIDRSVQFNVRVVDGVPVKGPDPDQPKVDDGKPALDQKVPVRHLNVERDALPSPAAEDSPFGRSSATVVRNAEDLEKQVGAAAAKALAKQVDFAKEQIVVVSWTGSGAAKLGFDRVMSKGKTAVEFFVDEPPLDGSPRTLEGRLGLDFFAVPGNTSVRFGKTASRNDRAVDPSGPVGPKSEVQEPKIAPPAK